MRRGWRSATAALARFSSPLLHDRTTNVRVWCHITTLNISREHDRQFGNGRAPCFDPVIDSAAWRALSPWTDKVCTTDVSILAMFLIYYSIMFLVLITVPWINSACNVLIWGVLLMVAKTSNCVHININVCGVARIYYIRIYNQIILHLLM